MILPTKGVPPNRTLLAVAGEVLRVLDEPKTVSRVWDDFRRRSDPRSEVTFDWFVLSLDLLFLLGTIELDRGRLRKASEGEGAA
ncbi:MAG: hypothetical protein K8H88_09890 [Sandaracinaceae bacterium]|nr:hypothetical protein [Sandaracinaceae bacterium]